MIIKTWILGAVCSLAVFCSATHSAQAETKLSKAALIAQLEARKDISFLKGKNDRPYVHFFAAEAEYGAFYSMPMLAEILNKVHGFHVSVSYSLDSGGNVDSRVREGLKGFELLEHADLAVFFTRSKALTKKTADQLQAYLVSGKPIVGFRTANHGFSFGKDDPDAAYLRSSGWTHKGPKLQSMWKHKFGGHHGGSHADGFLTAISKNEAQASHPILRGFTPYKDPRHLYMLNEVKGEGYITLAKGRALKIYPHKASLPKEQPTVIISEKGRRMFYSSTCGADTFHEPAARRLAVHGVFWALGMENEIPREGFSAQLVWPYHPPADTHLRKGMPHRGKPEKVFQKKY